MSYPETSVRCRFIQLVSKGIVQIPARRARYEMSLSHATTVHKSQGQEADHVIVVLPHTTSYMLRTCKLTYTAITRARKHLTIIGSSRCIGECIRNEGQSRITALRALLSAAQRSV